jgi:hypothetical protein
VAIPCHERLCFRKDRLSISSFLIPTGLKSLTGNIQDDCCKFVFIWIRICNIVPSTIYAETVGYASHSLETICTTTFKTTSLVQLMFGKQCYKSEMTMTLASFTRRSGVENIHHIHRSTGRARKDAINFVITTIGCCSPLFSYPVVFILSTVRCCWFNRFLVSSNPLSGKSW